MTAPARIILDPAILAGKPVVRGTRLLAEFVIGLMADGWSEADILANYPSLSHEDIAACPAYARDALSTEKIYPSAALHALSGQRKFPGRRNGRTARLGP
jgi:uncharacterized protein (DUF433 family)